MKTIRGLAALLAALVLLLGAAGAALSVVGPAAVDDDYPAEGDPALDEDTALVVDAPAGLLANDNAVAETCAVVVSDVGLDGTLALNLDGSFTFTPASNFNGETSFTYGIKASGDETCSGEPDSQATVTIKVDPVNDPPTAGADSFGVVKNLTLIASAPGVLGNDLDVDHDTLTAWKVNSPSHGVAILAPDGSFSYKPNPGYVGPDVFSYYASDNGSDQSPGHRSTTQVVTLTVTAIPPIATPTPAPTPSPTVTPIPTPEETIAEPSPSAEASASIEPSASPGDTVAPSMSPSPSPGSSAAPGPVDSEGGGISLPVLLVIILFVLLVGFGAALYVPKWLAAQRGEPTDLD